MATRPKEVTSNLSAELAPAPLPESATVTRRSPEADIQAAIAAVVLAVEEHAELVDDLDIALHVRMRDSADSGERIPLEDFMRQEGYDPSDFGLE